MEFALVITFLVFALALVLQFSMVAYAKILATNAAQEAARSAAVHSPSDKDMILRSREQAVENVIEWRVRKTIPFASDASVEVVPKNGGGLDQLVFVKVTVQVPSVGIVLSVGEDGSITFPQNIEVVGRGRAYIEPWPGHYFDPNAKDPAHKPPADFDAGRAEDGLRGDIKNAN